MSMMALLLSATVTAAPGDEPNTESNCGGYCLYVALRALDLVPGPYSVFEKGLPKPGPGGYSFLELEQLAERFGAKTVAIEADVDGLNRLKGRRVCIALMGNHYVIVNGVDDHGDVQVIDPPYRSKQPLKQFRLQYSKRALILSLKPIALAGGGAAWRAGLITGSVVAGLISLAALAWLFVRRRGVLVVQALLAALLLQGCGRQDVGSRSTPAPTTPTPANLSTDSAARPPLRIDPACITRARSFRPRPDKRSSVRARSATTRTNRFASSN
ncbi:MAG: cysteine peptidase family C39 domain-containing protein [Isosphaeraceae bacterium]